MGSGYDVLLVRHGETHGYYDDVGLTELGETQAKAKGAELAAGLTAGATVRLPHARTARGTATAIALRSSLVEALGAGTDVTVEALRPDHHFDSLQFLHDGRTVEPASAAAVRIRLADGEQPPGWAVEYDRFDTDYRAGSAAGGPIDYWIASTTTLFEPPQVVVYRAWHGILAAGEPDRPDGLVVIACSHSALLRSFAAAAVGHDPGEPENLEYVGVRVHPDRERAEVSYRTRRVEVDIPKALPPWIDPGWLVGNDVASELPGLP